MTPYGLPLAVCNHLAYADLMEKAKLLEQAQHVTELGRGEMFVAPAGVEHCPTPDEETVIMCIEPRTTAATGGA